MVCDGYNRVINQDGLDQMWEAIYFHYDGGRILSEGECYESSNLKNKQYLNKQKWGRSVLQASVTTQANRSIWTWSVTLFHSGL